MKWNESENNSGSWWNILPAGRFRLSAFITKLVVVVIGIATDTLMDNKIPQLPNLIFLWHQLTFSCAILLFFHSIIIFYFSLLSIIIWARFCAISAILWYIYIQLLLAFVRIFCELIWLALLSALLIINFFG